MNPQSIFSIRHWDLPQLLFLGAAAFAMAAVGFFLAVFLQLHSTPSSKVADRVIVPVDAKLKAMAGNETRDIPADANNRADPSDSRADAKLKLLATPQQ